MGENILEVRDLTTRFRTQRGELNAVEGVSFHVERGEILGLVGESGCGKSVTSQSVLRLYDERRSVRYSGQVLFEGRDLLALPEKEMRAVRGSEIAMVFQDSLSSLNPVLTCGDQIMEAMRIHQKLSRAQAREKAAELLRLVGIPGAEERIDQYPHQLSGGMRQRVMIACALSCRPKLLIADEPTTALDVTIQAQILDLIRDLNRELDTAVLFITHDLGVVSELCDTVIVMYTGRIVEQAPVRDLFREPRHPYTVGLLEAIPRITREREPLSTIQGMVPNPTERIEGCTFWPRCPHAAEQCKKEAPPMTELSGDRRVRCWLYGDGKEEV